MPVWPYRETGMREKDRAIRAMAGPPHRQRLSCADYGKCGTKSSARHRLCSLPAGEPVQYPIRHPAPHPHHCRSQKGLQFHPACRKPASCRSPSHPGTGTLPPDKSLPPTLPALLNLSLLPPHLPHQPGRIRPQGMPAAHARQRPFPLLDFCGPPPYSGRVSAPAADVSLSCPTREVSSWTPCNASSPAVPAVPMRTGPSPKKRSWSC